MTEYLGVTVEYTRVQFCPVRPMAKPNYQYDKRQREIKKAQQQEEKRQKKQARNKPEQTNLEDQEEKS